MIPTLIVVSMLSFVIIQLPPGDFLTSYAAQLRAEGDTVDQQELDVMRDRYGFGEPVYMQYGKWIKGILTEGDFGQSLEWKKPVQELIWERFGLTMLLALVSIMIGWFVAIPIGVYSATHQYSVLDYVLTVFSFIGAGTPGFMIALVVMWIAMRQFGLNVGGLFSQEFVSAPWSWAKVADMLQHLWIPVLILTIGGTAGGIRTTRANLLDELNKPYVETARAKGLTERRLVWKYPTRVALNPFFSTVGWSLANQIGGLSLIAVVLSLQTTGPMMLRALISQDMYLAGSFIMLLSLLTVVGTLVSDILLAWVDPRIRMGV
jgi:peptide/nickel transport system permease protein